MTGSPAADGWHGYTGRELAEAWRIPVVEAYRSIGSTNDRAAELGRSGSPTPAVVVAEKQTAGRGRRGDRWQSASGSGIWLSLLLGGEHAFPQLPLVVGVACARAVDRAVPETGRPLVSVKWPNDLMVGDRKVGGILCESGPFGLVIGVGLNVTEPEGGFDPSFARSATALEVHTGKGMDTSGLAEGIVAEILASTRLHGAFERAWEELAARDALHDRDVLTEEHGPGIARGINRDGALLVEGADGVVRPVRSGSVRLTEAGGSA